jgi:radical SAM protein with 4Fe4S-binding SPASM domain
MGNNSMSSENFEKMLQISENLIEKGVYDHIAFRLSGGEPLLVFDMYKDLVTKCHRKMNGKFTFGILTNLTNFTDEIADWILLNNIGMQVSLDDLSVSKPLNNGESSADIVLRNIIRAQSKKVDFQINTILDIKNTNSLIPLCNYICNSFKEREFGLSTSYMIDKDEDMDKVINIFKEAIDSLLSNGFDVHNKLRFYNMIPNSTAFQRCALGDNAIAIGTNLEIWPCQSLTDKKVLGYYDENIKTLLETSEDNKYYYNRTLFRECVACSILGHCRGGCRAAHTNPAAMKITCHIRREIMMYIFNKLHQQFRNFNNQQHDCNCNCGNDDHQNHADGFEKIIKKYLEENPNIDTLEETPLPLTDFRKGE